MSTPGFSLANKIAIVTGARRGICKAIALGYAQAGADVAVADVVDDGELTAVADEIKRMGRRSLAVKADISKKADVERMVGQTVEAFGTVDILFNGAGIMRLGSLIDLSEEEWDKVMDIDLKGYFLCSQAAARIMMPNKKGNIISVASTSSFKALPNRGAYGIAKAGVAMLTRVLAVDLAPYNIRVNAIAPGMVKTELARPVWENQDALKSLESRTPLGRIADPDEIVGAALFLATDMSTFVTGHTLLIDGGLLA